MSEGIELNSFKKCIILNRPYIISKIKGNDEYGAYVPNNINPQTITRRF